LLADERRKALSTRTDRNRNGILDRDEALARKIWRRSVRAGPCEEDARLHAAGPDVPRIPRRTAVPTNYRYYTPYGDIPGVLTDRYDLTNDYRYIYRDNVIYVVDPRTSLVTRVLDAILQSTS
jgi:hypothetical protein